MRIGAVGTVLVSILVARCGAAAGCWERQGKGFSLSLEQGLVTCDDRGRLSLRATGQAPLEVGFFLWHDAYVYETLAGGKVEEAAVQPDGALRLGGLWGARDGAAPLRYSLTLAPSGTRVVARLELQKTGELKLTDGVWASMLTKVATNDARTVYLFPTCDAPVGKAVEGAFKQVFLGTEGGPSIFFSGEGICHLRSRVSAAGHGMEVRPPGPRDFAVGDKPEVTMAFGFATMPKILRPVVTGRAALGLAARAPQEVPLYGKCEIDVALTGTWDNPYDPDDIALDASVATASGKTYAMPGFFMVPHRHEQEGTEDLMLSAGEGEWKVRLAATEAGPMRVTLAARDRNGRATFEIPHAITVTAAGHSKGFVRVSGVDARYLAHETGEGFVPVGHNLPIFHGSNGMSVKDILEKMAANGENWNRWWMSKSGLGIEWEPRLGWYRQAQAAKLDMLLEDAGRLGMCYQLCMDTHQDFRQEGWKSNPFNVLQGGPCKAAGDWFTDETAKAFYRKRLRYTVARWGFSPHVLCWEFGNEFEGWADAKQETIIAWHREMAPVLAALDPYDHLISTSWWSKTGPEACWQIPQMTVVQTHSYANNDLNVALETHAYCLTQWNGFEKPHLFAEFGIRSHNFSADADPTGRAIHNAAWAAIASGCCGIPMPWWHENYIEPKNLYFHFRAIRGFLSGLPFGTARWRQVAVTVPAAVVRSARPSRRDVVALTRSEFRRPAESVFAISSAGELSNAGELLSKLHGGAHADLVNPPTFEVTYPEDGTFVVHVDNVSASGLLKIFIDDRLALERPMQCGENCGKSWRYVERWKLWESVYDEDIPVPVKAGFHRIRVENLGKDWISVPRYVFTGCRTQERQEVNCYALAAPSAAVVWIQNGDSDWVNHARHADEIRPFPAAAYALDGFADGAYAVEWWETWKGAPLRRETVRAEGGRLVLSPGPVATDLAARITRCAE
ncbi:MAG TPA: DUF5060 domain-containing protein [Verrucomicrobiae bacterium]|nr:DUF5060 domain-containing protein [Verrucomicrobiae bacterium]